MRSRVHTFRFAFVVSFAIVVNATGVLAQAVVSTLNFNPPGVTNNSGILQEVVVVENTGLVYAAGGSNKAVVIDPGTNAIVGVASFPTSGSIDFALVNQTTGVVYMRQLSSNVVVLDGRSASPTFNQALPTLTFPGYAVRGLTLDETRGLLYVAVASLGAPPVVGHILIIDADPASPNFHQTLHDIAMPVNSPPQGVAVNTATNKVYLGAQANGPGGMSGIFVLDGTTLSLNRIGGTVPSFEVEVNDAANLVYATSNANRLTVIDGSTNTLLALIPMPGLIANLVNERVAINRATGRVYVQSDDVLTPGKVIVVDGDRPSPTFNTVLTSITVGRNSNSILVDESLNRIITASIFDFGTFGTTIIDGATNTVIASIPANDWCFDTALNRLTHRAYTAARLFVMQKIDVAAGSLEAITVTGSEAGFGVVNPNNHLLYASAAAQTSEVLLVDQNGARGAISGLPHHNGSYFLGTINRTTNRVYFSNGDANLSGLTFAAPGFVSVIDGLNNSVLTNVAVGNRPFGIKANEATDKIYVANFGGNTNTPGGISVIDGASNTVVSADVSAFPVTNRIFLDLAVNEATNKIYFWLNNGTVGVLDGATNVASQLPPTLGPAANIRVNKVLNRVYVPTRTGVLHVLDGSNDTEIATLAIGSQNPADSLAPNIVVNETTGRVFVTDFNNGTVTVVDGATNSSLATVAVGSGPTAPAINELTNRVYVSNLNDKTLSIIDGATATVKATLALPISLRSLSVDPVTSRIYGVSDLTDAQGGIVVVADAVIQSLGPAQVWIGLKNSDDVGTRFDLLAEVFKNNVPIGSGQLNSVAGGSSGFNNAKLDVINLALADNPGFGPGDTFSIRLSVRIAATGHRSGTARLWFNDAAANSHLTATIGSVTGDYFMRSGFALGATAGSGPKNTIDVFADRAAGGNPFKPFGTWSVTF